MGGGSAAASERVDPTDGVVGELIVAAGAPGAAPDEAPETCVASVAGPGEAGAGGAVSSSGVFAPQAGQKRLLGVRAVEQAGQVRGMGGCKAYPIPIRKIIPARFRPTRFENLLAVGTAFAVTPA